MTRVMFHIIKAPTAFHDATTKQAAVDVLATADPLLGHCILAWNDKDGKNCSAGYAFSDMPNELLAKGTTGDVGSIKADGVRSVWLELGEFVFYVSGIGLYENSP